MRMEFATESSAQRFQQGFNCAQSVLSAFASRHGLEAGLALRIAGPFGAGVARRGEMCGAVSGGLMALGLRHGSVEAQDAEAKRRLYSVAQDFLRQFEARCGSLECRGLLGLDLSRPGSLEAAEQRGLFTDLCPGFVRAATEIVEALST